MTKETVTLHFQDSAGESQSVEVYGSLSEVFDSHLTGFGAWDTGRGGYLQAARLVEIVAYNPELAHEVGEEKLRTALRRAESFCAGCHADNNGSAASMMQHQIERLQKAVEHLGVKPR